MILDILDLLDDDFSAEMECKYTASKTNRNIFRNTYKYSQKEAREMARRLSEIYWIAHCEYCASCAEKYRVESTKKNKNNI